MGNTDMEAAKERFRQLLECSCGNDPDNSSYMNPRAPRFMGYFNIGEDEDGNAKAKGAGGKDAQPSKKPAPAKQPPSNGKKAKPDKPKPSEASMLKMIQAQNLELFRNLRSSMEKLPSQKEIATLSSEVDKALASVERLARRVEELEPPTEKEKALQIQAASGPNMEVGDYWRNYQQKGGRIGGYDGTLDSIAGKSFRDYLNI